jgi:hypothetical protein
VARTSDRKNGGLKNTAQELERCKLGLKKDRCWRASKEDKGIRRVTESCKASGSRDGMLEEMVPAKCFFAGRQVGRQTGKHPKH